MKKIVSTLVVTLLILAVLSGCTPSSNPAPDSNPDPDPNPGSIGEPVTPDPDPLPSEELPTTLSVLMTQEDIIDLLGDDYNLETVKDDYMFNYISELSYEGILFLFCHEQEELTEDAQLCEIRITSNDYKFNYEMKVGDTALDAISKCEEVFENLYDYHNDKHRFDVFKYREKKSNGDFIDTSFVITWEYDTDDIHYESKEDVPQDLRIKTIRIFEPWN